MRKIIVRAVLVVVILLAGFIGVFTYQHNKEREDFYAFREYLDEEYFPVLHKFNDHVNSAVENTTYLEYSSWQVEKGFEENLDIQSELKAAREKIVNRDVKEEDTQDLKKSVLNTITDLEETLDYMYNGLNYSQDFESFDYMFSEEMKDVNDRIDEMNEILGIYYE
ncbi:hypothetical protein [Bacillus sp. EB01]|uniref:hypothetical protein n=1 Tax=Bacillus sp. EB01 TaxID=1347086 RepID=UPI0005C4E591|nr:hypothetical protein [Bacillus sp. EB01]